VLQARRVLPVEAALAPALLDARRGIGDERRRAEERIAGRPELGQLHDAVAVRIGPCARVGARSREASAGHGAAERAELAPEADRLARDVAADARLDRGLAVAPQIVGESKARVD